MRILICDDCKDITRQLCIYIKDFFARSSLSCPPIDIFYSGEALLSDLGPKDIVFLDIEMPGVSGIFTGSELKKRNPDLLIFIVTSFSEYLDDAMRMNVFRYLSKPIEKERLFKNLEDAIKIYNSTTHIIPIVMKDSVKTVSSKEIIAIEAKDHKVFVYTTSGQFQTTNNMSYWAEHLPHSLFYQSHRSFWINMYHVTDFDHSMIYLYNRKYAAYLTRRKYNDFKKQYLRYIEFSN